MAGFFAKVFSPEAVADFNRRVAPLVDSPYYAEFSRYAADNDENQLDTFASRGDQGQFGAAWTPDVRDYVMRTADSIRDAKKKRKLFGFIPLSPSTYEKVGEVAGGVAKVGLIAGAAYAGAVATGLAGASGAAGATAEGAAVGTSFTGGGGALAASGAASGAATATTVATGGLAATIGSYVNAAGKVAGLAGSVYSLQAARAAANRRFVDPATGNAIELPRGATPPVGYVEDQSAPMIPTDNQGKMGWLLVALGLGAVILYAKGKM